MFGYVHCLREVWRPDRWDNSDGAIIWCAAPQQRRGAKSVWCVGRAFIAHSLSIRSIHKPFRSTAAEKRPFITVHGTLGRAQETVPGRVGLTRSPEI